MSTQKRMYAVGCHTPEDWDHIHEVLLQDESTEDFVPCHCVECADLKEHSLTRAVYLLTDEEAEELKNHAKIKFIHLDIPSNPDVFKKPYAKDLYNAFRYTTNSKHYRSVTDDNGNSLLPTTPTSADINRCGYQLLRSTQKTDPWLGDNYFINSRVPYTSDGKHVDVVVGDDGCWHGHPEFQNNTGNGPTNYVGGNVLPGNGTCDLLDLVLDSPYYIDPAWFNANAATRLMTRWDGTIVPTESAARSWWSNGATRSAAFANIGTVPVSSAYTRDAHCGSNTKRPPVNGQHGTACASQAFGRTLGWAFNANKWTISAIADVNGLAAGETNNNNEIEYYFDIVKLFHLHKPINSIYGNKNPTVNSNSWGYSGNEFKTTGTTKYYFYRKGASGGTGVAYTPTLVGNIIAGLPQFLNNFTSRIEQEMISNGMVEAGNELIASGVICFVASGNSNQKQVNSKHKDYNNYWATTSSATLAGSVSNQFDMPTYNTINRAGFPAQIGKTINNEYPTISVGALDDNYHTSGKEQKVSYSNSGNAIDLYAPAEGTLAANLFYPSIGNRPDTYPSIDGKFFSDGLSGVATASSFMPTDSVAASLTYTVTAPGSSFYTFSGSAGGNNPTLNVTQGDILTFNLNVSGHPFWIKTTNTTGTSNGVTTGTISNNGASSGTVTWNTSGVAAGTYYYICQFHGSMVGTINVGAGTTSNQLIIGNVESSTGMLVDTARRITTTSNNNVSVAPITFSGISTTGLVEDSTPSIGMLLSGINYSNYNGFWDVVLPFNINFGSLQTDKVFINTNSYVTFGTRPTNQNYDWDLRNAYTASEPPMPKIFITAADGAGQKVWTGVTGTTPNRTYKIIFEGSSGYGTASTVSTIRWEMTFYEASPYQIDLQMGINSNISKPSDCEFGGTSSACPVAAGFIATILQENRTWDWRRVKKYINSSMYSPTVFHIGKECRRPNDSAWTDKNSLQGSKPILLYNPKTNS